MPLVDPPELEVDPIVAEGRRLCALGYHAWTPVMSVLFPEGVRQVTACERIDCDRQLHSQLGMSQPPIPEAHIPVTPP